MAKTRKEVPGGGAPKPKVRVYRRREKGSQKHPKHAPASYFMADRRPAHTPRKGQTWRGAGLPQYRVYSGTRLTWTTTPPKKKAVHRR